MASFLIIIIILALIFDYINGFHDAANSIATVVSTKVLTPFQAVLWAALFNFVAFFIFTDHGVANTVAKTVHEGKDASGIAFITLPVIFAGLIASIAWNLLTWWLGIPSSSSHTLIGGFAGAAIAHAGLDAVNSAIVIKTASFIILAPLIGMVMALIISLWFISSFRKDARPKIISVIVIIIMGVLLSFQLKTDPVHLSGMKLQQNATKDSVFVAAISNGSTAQKMGLKKNDRIISIGQEKVISSRELNAFLSRLHTGQSFSYSVVRKDSLRQIDATYLVSHKSKAVRIIFFGENFKWILLTLILMLFAIFTFYLSTLNAHRANHWFKRLQLVSSAIFSIGHGGNDAQKVMGIIMAALIAYNPGHYSLDHMEWWVPLACYSAIALGTMSGGWKIVKTMGTRITKVTPFEGVAAETAGAVTLFVTEALNIPVSTTHTITGSIMGVGATKRLSAVRWGVTVNLLWAWILTIPISGLLAAGVYYIVRIFA